jgi:hypothetical protein
MDNRRCHEQKNPNQVLGLRPYVLLQSKWQKPCRVSAASEGWARVPGLHREAEDVEKGQTTKWDY